MTPTDDASGGTRDYVLLCLTALLVLLLGLVQMRMGVWSLMPVAVGGFVLVVRWRSGAVILLLTILFLVVSRARGLDPGRLLDLVFERTLNWIVRVGHVDVPSPIIRPPRHPSGLSEGLLAVGTLAYCAGYYRLLGVAKRLFPPTPRRDGALAPATAGAHTRPASAVTGVEVMTLLGAVQVVAAGALAFWRWLGEQQTDLNIRASSWQGMVAVVLLGGGGLLMATALRAWAWRRLSRDEALLYLQDVVWRETRSEQRRLNRWLAWAWLRRQKREDNEPDGRARDKA